MSGVHFLLIGLVSSVIRRSERMNIADLVLVIVIVLVFGAAVYGTVKNVKNGKHCSGCGGACSGCRYAESEKRKSEDTVS